MIPALLCWGSLLNAIAYRLINDVHTLRRPPFCPHCSSAIAWHDTIPVISYCALGASCRNCKQKISWLYPAIEIFTAIAITLLFYTVPHYFFSYFIFFSALIVTLRSDMETMLISRFVTLFLIPIGIAFSAFGILPLSFCESVIGACCGYFMLFGFAKFFTFATGKEGIGQGDIELLAFIGSFTGFLGSWFSLFVGSTIGTLIMVPYMLATGQYAGKKVPFGPFLVLGAIIFVLYRDSLILFFTV